VTWRFLVIRTIANGIGDASPLEVVHSEALIGRYEETRSDHYFSLSVDATPSNRPPLL